MNTAFSTLFNVTASGLLATHFGGTVTLSRAADETDDVPAQRTEQSGTYETEDGRILTYDSVEWMIPVDSFIINGSAVEPAVGDRITDGTDIYEVMPIGKKKHFEWKLNNTEYLIRTKRIAG